MLELIRRGDTAAPDVTSEREWAAIWYKAERAGRGEAWQRKSAQVVTLAGLNRIASVMGQLSFGGDYPTPLITGTKIQSAA